MPTNHASLLRMAQAVNAMRAEVARMPRLPTYVVSRIDPTTGVETFYRDAPHGSKPASWTLRESEALGFLSHDDARRIAVAYGKECGTLPVRR